MTAFANRLPTGPGSRGGRWHDPEFRRAYNRAWRAGHPEYRERERFRRARERALARNEDPADIAVLPSGPRSLPIAAEFCGCSCGCTEQTTAFDFNLWLRDALKEVNLSQRALGRAAGIDHAVIIRLVSGRRRDSNIRTIRALTAALLWAGATRIRCGFCREGMHSEESA